MILETERLLLRPLCVDDAEEMFHNWANDPEVTRFLTWRPHADVTMTEYVLGLWEREYADPKTVRFGIVDKSSGELMGTIDIVRFVDGDPELGYCLGKRFWGRGFMTEAAGKVIEHLKALGYKKVIISAEIENVGSLRVIEKLGLTFVKREKGVLPLKENQPFTYDIFAKTL